MRLGGSWLRSFDGPEYGSYNMRAFKGRRLYLLKVGGRTPMQFQNAFWEPDGPGLPESLLRLLPVLNEEDEDDEDEDYDDFVDEDEEVEEDSGEGEEEQSEDEDDFDDDDDESMDEDEDT